MAATGAGVVGTADCTDWVKAARESQESFHFFRDVLYHLTFTRTRFTSRQACSSNLDQWQRSFHAWISGWLRQSPRFIKLLDWSFVSSFVSFLSVQRNWKVTMAMAIFYHCTKLNEFPSFLWQWTSVPRWPCCVVVLIPKLTVNCRDLKHM